VADAAERQLDGGEVFRKELFDADDSDREPQNCEVGRGRILVMRKRKPRFNVDPETGELVEIDEELSAAIDEAAAQADRGEGIPWEVFRKRWEK
jgi:hypothetical protein